jgi:serine/threonine protein kinase
MAHPQTDTLAKWITGTLDPDASAEVEAHLERCVHCEDTVSQLESQQPTSLQWIREAGASTVSGSSARVAEPVPQRLGPYQLQGELGRGGMGTVYRAVHERLDKVVAIKILPRDHAKDPTLVARFHREMKAVGRVDHPNIVRATDAGEIDGTLFLVMEYVDGRDLAAIQRRIGHLPVADACESIRQAALALEEAAANGMIHRDVKPSNLMVARSRTGPAIVKLLDLGLARLGAQQPNELTSTGQIMGSIDYMSPEQCDNTHSVDIRSDIYSLGATLYRLLSGQTPFGANAELTLLQKLNAIATKSPQPIGELCDGLPEGLPELIDSMLDKLPENRPNTPVEVANRIAAFTDGNDLDSLLDPSTVVPHSGEEAATRSFQQRPIVDIVLGGGAETYSQLPYESQTPEHVPIDSAKPEPDAFKKLPRRGLLIALGFAGATMIAAAIVFMLSTRDGGTIRFEVNDPGIKIAFADRVYTIDDAGKEYRIAEGAHRLRISHDDVEFETTQFQLGKGERTRLKVSFEDHAVKLDRDGQIRQLAPIADTSADVNMALGSSPESHADTPDSSVTVAANYALEFHVGAGKDAWHQVTMPTLKDGVESMTMELWLKPQPGAGRPHSRIAGFQAHNNIGTSGGADLSYVYGTIALPSKKYVADIHDFTHVAAVRDAQREQFRFYVDGKLLNTQPLSKHDEYSRATLANTEEVAFFGLCEQIHQWGETADDSSYRYVGLIDEVRVSSAPRYTDSFEPKRRWQTDAQTVALYHFDEGSGDVVNDESGNGHHGKIVGASWVNVGPNAVPAEAVPSANPNSGEADAMDLPAIAFDSELPGDALSKEADVIVDTVTYGMFVDKSVTMEVWVRRDPENLSVWRFMGVADLVMMASAGDHHRPIDLRWEGGLIGSEHPYKQVVDGWHHLAAVRDRQKREHRFYINGKCMNRVPFNGEPYMPPLTHGEPLVFAHGYTGHLGPARVSSIARYDEDFVPLKRFETDANTIAIYNLEVTSDNQVLIDSSGNDHHGRILRGRYVPKRNSSR